MVVLAVYQSALMYGAVIGLLAIGFRLTQEVSGYMNLGYVVNFGVGMMLGFIVSQQTGIAPILVVPFSFILTGLFNTFVYLLFYRRMEIRKYPETLIGLFGLSSTVLAKPALIVSTYWLNLRFESEHWCRPGSISDTTFFLNHLHYRFPGFWGFRGGFIETMILFASIVFFTMWVYGKDLGIKFRAAAENASLLEVCGVNPRNLKALAWFVAGGLSGVAGILSPYALKGEFGRDVEIFFVPVILAVVIIERRELWVAGVMGLLVGFAQMVVVNTGQGVIGVWFAEYWNVLNVIFLAIVLYLKDRRFKYEREQVHQYLGAIILILPFVSHFC